jgi:hypothetical protein
MHNSPDRSNSAIINSRPWHAYSRIECQIPKGDASLGLKPISLAPGGRFTSFLAVLPSPVGNQRHYAVTGHKSTIPSPFRKGDGFARLIPGIPGTGGGCTVLWPILPSPLQESSQVEIMDRLRFPRGTIWNNKNVYTRLKQLVVTVYEELSRPPFERGTDIWPSNVGQELQERVVQLSSLNHHPPLINI